MEDGVEVVLIPGGFEVRDRDVLITSVTDSEAQATYTPLTAKVEKEDQPLATLTSTFVPPNFGVTVLGNSHGFDAKGKTSGFIVWIYGKGVMVTAL